MILSMQKCCLLLSGVSTESKTYICTSDKAGVLATRNATIINVGLVFSYMKLLLSSYIRNLEAWYINKSWGFLRQQTVLYSERMYFHIVMRGILCLIFTNLNGMTLYIDTLNDTCRYLDYIFNIDNPELDKHIPDIYSRKKESVS